MHNITIDLLQKHQESIAKDTCSEVIRKIQEYQNHSRKKLNQTYRLAVDSICKSLLKEDDASLSFFVNDLVDIQHHNNLKPYLTIEGLNILKNVIAEKLIEEDHIKPGQVIAAIEKINSIQAKLIVIMFGNYQNHSDEILEKRDKELNQKIRKASDDLKRLEQFNENILQSMTSGLLVVDNQNYIIQKFNKAMETITGFPASAVLGKSLEEAFSYIHGINFEYFYNEIKTKGKFERTKLKLTRDSGENVFRFIKGDSFHDKSGNTIGIILIIDDVTENEIVKKSFSRYVAHQLVERILNGSEKVCLSGVRKRVTVLFADIRGFTSLSEKCEPEKVVSMLNDFFSLMVDVIFKYEGTLDKFIGDNIMAIFGAPVGRPDDAERAVFAALEMQRKIKILNKNRQSGKEKPLEIGIGINTGEAIAGNIGSEKRMDYTVIGDVVNFADRIQSQSKGGEILISEFTHSKVKDKIAVEKLIPRHVKGKQKEVVLYKVLEAL